MNGDMMSDEEWVVCHLARLLPSPERTARALARVRRRVLAQVRP